jgi:hypothetical protein
MTDDLTETTDMNDNDTPTDDATPNPLDLLPVGDTDVLADVEDSEEIADPTSELQDQPDDADESDSAEHEIADSDTTAEGSASDEADAARGGSEADDEPATQEGSASDEADTDADLDSHDDDGR